MNSIWPFTNKTPKVSRTEDAAKQKKRETLDTYYAQIQGFMAQKKYDQLFHLLCQLEHSDLIKNLSSLLYGFDNFDDAIANTDINLEKKLFFKFMDLKFFDHPLIRYTAKKANYPVLEFTIFPYEKAFNYLTFGSESELKDYAQIFFNAIKRDVNLSIHADFYLAEIKRNSSEIFLDGFVEEIEKILLKPEQVAQTIIKKKIL